MASKAKEKFDAAVKVIQSLPKDGPFQPSYDMMLIFYGHFKQATEGPCTKPQPWAWDLVNRKKWDAWKKLGDMPREEAMLIYVDELKKTIKHFTEKGKEMKEKGDPRIVETMPQNQDVRAFMEKLDSFYEAVDEVSPVEEARRAHEGEINSTGSSPHNSDVSENDETLPDDDSMETKKDHSVMLENLVQKQKAIAEMINGLSKELDEDDEDDDDDEDDRTEHNDSSVITNGPVSFLQSDNHIDFNENHVEEGVKQNSKLLSHLDNSHPRMFNGEKMTSESESEEEFCDTSDQPSQEELHVPNQSSPSFSTPIKQQSKRVGNHVHFGASNSLRTDADIHNGVMSPVSAPPSQVSVPLISHLGISGRRSLGDSLVAHTSGEETLNASYDSESNIEAMKSVTLNSMTLNSVTPGVGLSGSVDAGKQYGGGNMPPPGGSTQGRGQRSRGASGNSRGQGFHLHQSQHGDGGSQGYSSGNGGDGQGTPSPPSYSLEGNINEHIAVALVRLQQDMNDVLHRLSALEAGGRQGPKHEDQRQSGKNRTSRWWPFPNMTGRNLFFVLVWPIVVHWILIKLFHRRRNGRS